MDTQEKVTLKMFVDAVKRHSIAVIIVIAAAFFGAFMGVLAYYNGWLG